MHTSIRKEGLIKLILGSAGMALIFGIVYFIRLQGFAPTSLAMIPLALPGAYGLSGLLELVAGVPFTGIAEKWDDLAGWQRGVLGTLAVILAFVLLIFGMVLFA